MALAGKVSPRPDDRKLSDGDPGVGIGWKSQQGLKGLKVRYIA
jgi:hypothetical protein